MHQSATRYRLRILKETDADRPQKRGDCEPCPSCQVYRDSDDRSPRRLACGHAPEQAIMHSRPCVFVGCERNTFLDVTRDGKIRYNRYGVEPDECEDSCAQDVADEVGAEGASHERIGIAMGITRNGAAVVIERSMKKMRRAQRKKRLR
jgi:hypothetical protein